MKTLEEQNKQEYVEMKNQLNFEVAMRLDFEEKKKIAEAEVAEKEKEIKVIFFCCLYLFGRVSVHHNVKTSYVVTFFIV